VAHLLSREKLRLDGDREVALRLDSEGCLLTWDDLQRAGDDDQFAAMHQIKLRPITIPGLEVPVMHIQSSYVRLAKEWSSLTKNAWIEQDAGRPLLYTVVHKRPPRWECQWDNKTPEVLRQCGLPVPSEPSTINLSDFGPVRARMQWPPKEYEIGAGTGQVFHDAVARHALRLLPRAKPVEMIKARPRLPKPPRDSLADLEMINAAVEAAGAERLHITCLYGNDQTPLRVRKALLGLLGLPDDAQRFAKDGIATLIGRVSVVFVAPRGAEARLSGQSDQDDVVAWAIKEICGSDGSAGSGVIRAAIIETGDPAKLRGSENDPKHKIRGGLAAEGVVTQFLSTRSFKR
jgi:hypothetical protein